MEGGTDFDVKILDIEEKERAHEAAKKKFVLVAKVS
jgi:hypothetical protein